MIGLANHPSQFVIVLPQDQHLLWCSLQELAAGSLMIDNLPTLPTMINVMTDGAMRLGEVWHKKTKLFMVYMCARCMWIRGVWGGRVTFWGVKWLKRNQIECCPLHGLGDPFEDLVSSPPKSNRRGSIWFTLKFGLFYGA
jgi:hypothetical protein